MFTSVRPDKIRSRPIEIDRQRRLKTVEDGHLLLLSVLHFKVIKSYRSKLKTPTKATIRMVHDNVEAVGKLRKLSE